MVIYLGADHRGFKLKNLLRDFLEERGYEVVDLGNEVYDETDDYPDYAAAVAEKVSSAPDQGRGILICGSGIGVAIVANKFPKIRAVSAMTSNEAYDSRHDDDSNILAFGADYLSPEDAKKILVTWLETPFSGESRHLRRIGKILEIEERLNKNLENRK